MVHDLVAVISRDAEGVRGPCVSGRGHERSPLHLGNQRPSASTGYAAARCGHPRCPSPLSPAPDPHRGRWVGNASGCARAGHRIGSSPHLATVVVGGLCMEFLLTLFALPAVSWLAERWWRSHSPSHPVARWGIRSRVS